MSQIKQESGQLRDALREKTVGYIVAAFGLVAGLAWNEAIKALIEFIFPLSANTLLAKFLYAVLITLVVVVLSTYLLKLAKKDKGA